MLDTNLQRIFLVKFLQMDFLSKLDRTNLNGISLIILVSSSLLLNCHFNNPLIVDKLVFFLKPMNLFQIVRLTSLFLELFAEALKMHLLLCMILLVLGILNPGICAKYIELERIPL